MKPIYTQNLGIIITEKCNLNCKHCMRGSCSNNEISNKIIEAIFTQIKAIGGLSICGGEPTLSLNNIEKIFSHIIENKILVDEISITINGTIYSQELLRLLSYINKYLKTNHIQTTSTNFAISWDKFHHEEIKRLNLIKEYLENIEKYQENEYFLGIRNLQGKLFREGNAEKLPKKLTVPLRTMKPYITYVNNNKLDKENGLCNIGPAVAINVNGTITECDASIKHQETIYNYGNILTNSIEEVFIKRNAKILTPQKWNKATIKAINKYQTYNR